MLPCIAVISCYVSKTLYDEFLTIEKTVLNCSSFNSIKWKRFHKMCHYLGNKFVLSCYSSNQIPYSKQKEHQIEDLMFFQNWRHIPSQIGEKFRNVVCYEKKIYLLFFLIETLENGLGANLLPLLFITLSIILEIVI